MENVTEKQIQDAAEEETKRYSYNSEPSYVRGAKWMQEQQSKWTLVSDRLPEQTNDVLGYSDEVLVYSDKLFGKYFISKYDHHDEIWHYERGHDAQYNPITHWQSLPNTPKP